MSDMSRGLIYFKTRGNFGLARQSWLRTLKQIRALPTQMSNRADEEATN